jgi:hypothetical protein
MKNHAAQIVFKSLAMLFISGHVLAAKSIFDARIESGKTSRRLYDIVLDAGIDREAVKTAFEYFDKNTKEFDNKEYMTLIDFNKPSQMKRFFLINLKTGKIEKHLVSHGRGSGAAKATEFTNGRRSGASSLGFYMTAEVYMGRHGRSLKLDGLSASNSNARARAIVIHAAGGVSVPVEGEWKSIPYVSERMINIQGSLGRSLGCPALDPAVAQIIIDKIKNGSLIYAFADESDDDDDEQEAPARKSVKKQSRKKKTATGGDFYFRPYDPSSFNGH